MAVCALCELSDDDVRTYSTDADWVLFDCLGCGKFRVSNMWRAAKMTKTLSQDELLRLRGVVRRDTDEHGECATVITTDSYKHLLARHDQPVTALQQMERFLLLAADSSPYVGADTSVGPPEAVATRIYFRDFSRETMERFMAALQDGGYLKRFGGGFDCKLTRHGWELAERVRATRNVGDQAFVAMWFSPNMDEAFDDGFAPTLRTCGYNPYRVDRKEHNNRIDDEIIANIRKSRVVVADLTGMRPNAFYEAGFAHGLGIPLILTCQENEMGHYVEEKDGVPTPVPVAWVKMVEERAFDLRQYIVMRWASPADLAAKLKSRIEALALVLKTPSGE